MIAPYFFFNKEEQNKRDVLKSEKEKQETKKQHRKGKTIDPKRPQKGRRNCPNN